MHNDCIPTESLQPGMVIVQVTKQNGPLKIRKSGLVSSVEMIQGLVEMGIQEVQIDPTQTVEIETTPVQTSSTLNLLQSRSNLPRHQDSQLHDQFNRSLFLPSVQDIPSLSQFYARRYGILTLIILMGLALGFAAGYIPNVISLRNPLVTAEPIVKSSTVTNTETANDNEVSSENVTKLQDTTVIETTKESNISHGQPQTDQALIEPTPPNKSSDQPQSSVTKQVEESPKVQALESPSSAITQASEVATQAQKEQLSPELLKRFEKVIKQMDQEAVLGDDTSEPYNHFAQTDQQISSSPALSPPNHNAKPQAVLRIDQLPAWVLNELPSMSFSAHMYASEPAERWVRVNGQRMMEGDMIDNKVRIVQIASQHVILAYQGHEFSMMAMTDW